MTDDGNDGVCPSCDGDGDAMVGWDPDGEESCGPCWQCDGTGFVEAVER